MLNPRDPPLCPTCGFNKYCLLCECQSEAPPASEALARHIRAVKYGISAAIAKPEDF